MVKNDLIATVAEAIGVTHMRAIQPVEALIETLSQALARHDRVELRGFGVFEVRPVRTGVGRNPKRPTERFQIPPGFTIRFRAGRDLREALAKGELPVPPSAIAAEVSKS